MRIAFNPSTVAALIAPPNNKDITFDLRGQNIFVRGVKFCGTDTNTWRDIKINNVSIGSNTLDLRGSDNTTLTNINGIVTINSTWRPVVDNLTSDSTTSSLSANLGRILKALIDGKSDSDHNHDDRYVKKSGDTMFGALNFANGTWNLVGDDSYMGDCNISGHFGIKAAITTYPGIAFFNKANDHLGNLTAYNGNIKYGAYSLQFLDNGNTSVSASTWMNPFSTYDASAITDGQAICVWGQSSSLRNLAADSGYMSLWLKRVNANVATLNMVLDGEYYANGSLRLAHVSEIPNSLKNPYALTISLNGTSQGPYDGSVAKNINITPSSIGAATSDHNHDGRYVRYYAVSTLDCNNLAIGLTAAGVSATNAGNTNHSAFLYISDVGTPFQIQIPDSGVPYIYKRYYSSGTWSGWFKLNAGYADSAGNADTIDGLHYSSFLRKDTNDSTPYQYTFTKTDGHAIKVGTVRGTAVGSQTGEYIHLYERVAIGSPNGWGSRPAPSYGLATYGGAWLATDTGSVGIGTTNPSSKLTVNGDISLFNVGSIKNLSIGGGIYWNTHVESPTDGSDAASITLVKSGVAGGTTLVLSLMSDANDTILFQTNSSARLYHNSYPILTTLNTYVNNNKGYINGTEITLVNNADTVDGYHASSLWRSDGATWNPGANVSLNASANNQEWSFDIRRNGYTGCYWHVWDSARSTMLKVNADNGKVYAPYNFVGNLEGNANYAAKSEYSRSLLGRSTSGSDFGASSDKLVFAEWNTMNDSRWYLKATGYECRVGFANNASRVYGSVGDTGTHELVRCVMNNDQFRIIAGSNGNNNGWAEIATADDGNEPIYVRQYAGVFSSVKRTLTLLDESGNTTFPGSLSIGGQIIRGGYSTTWVLGRNVALLRETIASGYHTLWSLKTTNGSWDFGEYVTSGWYNVPVLSYITDSNYNSGNNVTTYQIKFPLASGTVALTSYGGDSSHPIFLGYLNLEHGDDGTISSSFYCLGYSVSFTYTRGGNYCRINIPDTTHQVFYIKAAIASVNYSGGGMDTWVGQHRGEGAWWLHCYASNTNEVRVKGFHLRNSNNDSWWGGNPLWSGSSGANRITVCIFGYVTFR